MIKRKIKYLIVILVFVVISVSGIFVWQTLRSKDPRQCVEEKLGITLSEGIVLDRGEVHTDQAGEERVSAKFKIEPEEVENLKKDLEKHVGKTVDELPRKSNIWKDLQSKKILESYGQFFEGKKAKTVTVNAYIATDDTGEYYFYIFY